MNEKTFATLEFEQVLKHVASYAISPMGQELVLRLAPCACYETVSRRREELFLAMQLFQRYPAVPFEGIRDIRGALHKVERGGVLLPQEFLNIVSTARAAKNMRAYLEEKASSCPAITAYARKLHRFSDIEAAVSRAITEEGEVADGASPELSQIRRRKRAAQSRLRDYLEGLVRSSEVSRYLQEPIITIRSDRYVLPVKQEYKSHVPGIVHDVSASGATLFVEPARAVEMTNEIKIMEIAEAQEVDKVLRELTKMVHAEIFNLQETVLTLGELDCLFARVKYGADMRGVAPVISEMPILNIVGGRHPLLSGNVVPVDIRIGDDFDILVITGPNTGGKTVALKTAGLFVLMAQSGIPIPASSDSMVGVFDSVFCDIGDEQSIEQSLSTFSAHMSNIISILAQVTSRSLVLLDELGAGTDPTEGAALAMAILERLLEIKAKTIATTHSSELKTFAYTRERVENASVQFDIETLSPTYKLLIGIPGSSNAFEISARLGLDAGILTRAREFARKDDNNVELVIRDLHRAKHELERELEQARIDRDKAQMIRQRLEKELERFEARRKEFMEKSVGEARSIVHRAKEETRRILEAARQAEKERRFLDVKAAHEGMQKLAQELEESAIPVVDRVGQSLERVNPGDRVYVASLNMNGSVLSVSQDGMRATVQAGIMRAEVPVSDLRAIVDTGAAEEKPAPGRLLPGKPREVPVELHLRGMVVAEALELLDKYLDDASLAGLRQVRIVHGKGTGALRRAVSAYLSDHPRVAGFRPGAHGEGDLGITVVTLDV